MKIVLAPDSFKGNLRSPQVCDILADAIHTVIHDAEVVSLPMADGGEGTTEAVVNAWEGTLHTVAVTGPLGRPVDALYGLSRDGRTAILDMASASGLELLTPGQLNPLKMATDGVGELLKAVLAAGARDIIMGVGGSATVDGGVGLARALGVVFLDGSGKPMGELVPRGLRNIRGVDASMIDPALKETRLRVACDVMSPLLGGRGAARVFGPQKGATPDMVEILEDGLENLHRVVMRQHPGSGDCPGDGAAGGLGFGLRSFCGGKLVSGAQLVAEAVGLEKHLRGADLVITGEGCADDQTLAGKCCVVVADAGRKQDVPVVLISGKVTGDIDAISERVDAVFSIATGPSSLADCLENAEKNLAFTARSVIKLWDLGRRQ